MKINLPVIQQSIVDEKIVTTETLAEFDIDTSVYSEERWEQNFPKLSEKESLFQYISRVQKNAETDHVRVACMLKAIYCFIESDSISSYKNFAQMFNLATPEYTERMITAMRSAFKLILSSSSVKN